MIILTRSKNTLCFFKILQSLSITQEESVVATSCSNTLKRKMERKHNEPREREMRGKSSSITISQDMVKKMSEGGVIFILGKAKLSLLDELQVSHIKEKSLLGFW
jgi:hypothetical protein